VRLGDGSRWGATFFTRANIDALFEKNRRTGECGGGLYFWSTGMIIVDQLDPATIDSLRDEGELEGACEHLGNGD
jgi:hypothetical protein